MGNLFSDTLAQQIPSTNAMENTGRILLTHSSSRTPHLPSSSTLLNHGLSTAVDGNYVPDYADVIILILNIYRTSHHYLPLELIVSILTEYSGYVPITEKSINRYVQAGNNADYKYLEINIPIYRYCRPHQVRICVNSHDQGWSSNDTALHGTRNGSFTWGEVSLSSSPQNRFEVYRNKHACASFEYQCKTFVENDVFLQKISEEYRCRSFNCFHHSSMPFTITLFVRSLYPGWCNHINYAHIRILWKLSGDFLQMLVDYMKRYPVRDYYSRPLADSETYYANDGLNK